MAIPSLTRRYMSRLYRIRRDYWRPWPVDFDRLINRVLASAGPDDRLIQIGANDGVSGDPLHKSIASKAIPSVRVEPVPALFHQLVANNQDLDFVQCVNCAISADSGTIPFYIVRGAEGKYPLYFSQIGSFDKSVIEKQRRDYPDIDQDIEAISVECKSFASLLADCGFAVATIIHTDVEGYDLDILELLDFDALATKVLIFEHVHVDLVRYQVFIGKLRGMGFKLRDGGTDTIAYR